MQVTNPAMQLTNGALILSVLKRVHGCWEDLCEEFVADPKAIATNTRTLTLYNHLLELRRLGIVEFEAAEELAGISGPIKVAKLWTEIQNALGHPPLLGIAGIASTSEGMVVKPVLGKPAKPKKPLDVFVAMPFTPELEPVYKNHVKKVVEKKLHMTVRRADDIFSANPVISDIWNEINAAKAVVADSTGKNPNVFYEIGLAHTVGKPVVVISQSHEDVPFDTKHIRYIQYSYDPEGIKLLEKKLFETLKAMIGPLPEKVP